MNIYKYLKKDHQIVSNLFDQILETNSMSKRSALIETLKTELLLHVDTANATFYDALKKFKEMENIIEHADRGNQEITEYFIKITAPSPHNENCQSSADQINNILFQKGA